MTGVPARLSAGDDRAEEHHDTEVMDGAGKVVAKRRPEGPAGASRLHGSPGQSAALTAARAAAVWSLAAVLAALNEQARSPGARVNRSPGALVNRFPGARVNRYG